MTDAKNVPYEKWSRAGFKLAYEEADAVSKRLRTERDEERSRRLAAETQVKEVTQQFADLKQRLLAAEQANQFLRGYVARVQEDDTVREELLTVGDPNGAQSMVPKRKATQFERPNDFTVPRQDRDTFGYMARDDEHRKPKHWITY